MTEKERETEIFKRIEQRELMKTRFEIEKKLRQARKAERPKEKIPRGPKEPKRSEKDREKKKEKEKEKEKENEFEEPQLLQTDFSSIDHKERSKERKKNIEENKKTDNKRFNAMAELKAKREGKQQREAAETARKEEQKKKDEEEQEKVSSKKESVKLKVSNIYSDDSESEPEGMFS